MDADRDARPGCRVLVVEDDESTRLLFVLALEDEGFSVVSARDGLEALQLLESQTFRLVVLDLHLPGISGQDFLSRYYQQPGSKAPVLVVSAEPNLERHIVDDAQTHAVLSKPFELEELTAKVHQMMSPNQPTDGFSPTAQ
jgi:DNA-binding response OmpR family regulator